jgi:signal transduction histidine kinase/putative methionine-R-sulfoxide reductase with GAF domain
VALPEVIAYIGNFLRRLVWSPPIRRWALTSLPTSGTPDGEVTPPSAAGEAGPTSKAAVIPVTVSPVLDTIAREAEALVRPSVAAMWIADEGARTLKVGAISGHCGGDLPFLQFAALAYGQGGVGVVAATRTALEVDDLLADTRFIGRHWWQSHGFSSFLGLPVIREDRLLGVLTLNGTRPLRLTAEARDQLAGLIDQAARALLGIQLEAERLRRQEVAASRAALPVPLGFEELLVRLSSTLVHLPSHEVETAFEISLQQLGQFVGVDRVTLYRLSPDAEEFVVAYSWSGPGVGPVPRVSVGQDFPWITAQILCEQPVACSRPDELPLEGVRDAETFRRRGVRSNLAVPMVASGRVLGCLAFATLTVERTWPEELVQCLRLVGELFANALAQKEADDTVRESELAKSAILASLSSSVVVLDREGRIVTVNDGWRRFARENGWPQETGAGVSYLDVWRRAAGGTATPQAAEALAGITAVLDGSTTSFALEYPSRTPDGERWFAISAVPLRLPKGGAVVSHTDITHGKLAELEAQRSRQELAHFTRVTTIGALTVSLAHELNQPLTGILANAQAALRLLEATPPDLVEIRRILADIVADDKRAGEVIRGLRSLLRKDNVPFSLCDVNGLIRGVARLLSSDAIIRNVTVRLELDPHPMLVSGDGVQLQQVVLNLLLNAMEAMAECTEGRRAITVRTERPEADTVHVSVLDAGLGLRQDMHDLLFEPFYTTKPSGVGMGLAISKSIIEAHGGRIWATDNAPTGAIFHFALPLADARSGDQG